MTKARDLALSFDALLALPDLLDELIDALLARAASGEFNGRDAAQVLYAAGLISEPTAAAMGAFLKGVAGDSAATVLFKANLIAEATAAAMAAYLKGGRGDVGPLPTIVDGNTTNGAPGSAAKVSFVATGKPGEYRADATLPVGYNGNGSGDVLAANNGSEFTNKDTFLSNVGAGIGAGGGRAVFKAANAAAIRTLLGLDFDGNGKLLASLMPAIAITDTFTVASQAAMLGLTAQRGDIAVRTDLNKTFSLATDDPSVLANWIELRTPTDAVLAVAGLVGAIGAADLVTALVNAAALAATARWPEASAIEARAGTASRLISAAVLWAMQAYVPLNDAASVAPNLKAGSNFTWTIAGNRVLANPIDATPGQEWSVLVTQGGAGGFVLSFGSAYVPDDLATYPVLNGAVGAVTELRMRMTNDGKVRISGGKPAPSKRVHIINFESTGVFQTYRPTKAETVQITFQDYNQGATLNWGRSNVAGAAYENQSYLIGGQSAIIALTAAQVLQFSTNAPGAYVHIVEQ